jgi:hypothetical protein
VNHAASVEQLEGLAELESQREEFFFFTDETALQTELGEGGARKPLKNEGAFFVVKAVAANQARKSLFASGLKSEFFATKSIQGGKFEHDRALVFSVKGSLQTGVFVLVERGAIGICQKSPQCVR